MRILKNVLSIISTVAAVTAVDSVALAQSNSLNTTLNGPTKAKKLQLYASAETSSNLYRSGTYEHEADTTFSLFPAFQLSDSFTLSSSLMVVQQHTGPENTLLLNTPVSLSYLAYQNESLRLNHKASVVLPTDRESNKVDKFRTAVTLGSDVSKKIESLVIPAHFLVGFALTRNVHEFNRTVDGAANIEFATRYSMGLSLSLTAKTTLSLQGTYTVARTYEESERYSFGTNASLDYAITKQASIYAGTGNRGSATQYNGVDSNISVFNENTSVIFAGLGYSF